MLVHTKKANEVENPGEENQVAQKARNVLERDE